MIDSERDPFVVAREVRANAALVSACISARAVEDHRHYARWQPGGVRLRSRWRHSYSSRGAIGGRRGVIRDFTDASRRRLRERGRETDWPAHRTLAFITLTWPRYFTADPVEWKAQLRAWRSAFERRWGQAVGFWVMEFQRRGAPHFHLALALPPGTSIEELRAWNAETWYRIAGHGDERHLVQHRKEGHCKKARSPRELIGYLQKEIAKRRQKELPDWLADRMSAPVSQDLTDDGTATKPAIEGKGAGRWWGVWRLGKPVFLVDRMSEHEWHAARRVVRRLERSRGVKPRRFRSKRDQGVSIADARAQPWSLAQSMYWFLLYLRGGRRARWSYALFDERANLQMKLGPPVTV